MDKSNTTSDSHHHHALAVLNYIVFELDGTLSEQFYKALRLGRKYLNMDAAVISEIEGNESIIRWSETSIDTVLKETQRFPLDKTYCDLVLKDSGVLAIEHMKRSKFHHHPYYTTFGIESNIGVCIDINGRNFGTLNFCSFTPRQKSFDDSEKLFVRLLARWLSTMLEQKFAGEKLNKLMAQVPGMIYQFHQTKDGHTSFPFSSPGIRSVYGISSEEVVNDAGPVYERLHPNDRAAVEESIERSARTMQDWQIQYRVQNGDGQYRWVAGQARPEALADGSILWHGYIFDIHERKQAELALEASEARFRSLFELSPIGIALNDFETGQFIEINAAFLRPTGYTRKEFVALSYWDITPCEFEPLEKEMLEQLKQTGQYGPFEKEYIRKDGSRYPVRLQGILVKTEENQSVIWSLIEDISEQKKLDRMKNQFIATVSHELRTPLTSLVGSLDLMLGGAAGTLSEKAEHLLGLAKRNGQRLAILINDLLDMEKLVAGRMKIVLSEQELMPLVNESIESNSHFGAHNNVTINLVGPTPSVVVNIDGQRFLQSLSNLLSNAIKFSPDGAQVEVRVTVEDGKVRISVKDKGPGIDESFRSKIFQRFAQADASDKRAQTGTGLGLAITRELMHRMGGEVGFESSPGEGAVFWLLLPIVDVLS